VKRAPVTHCSAPAPTAGRYERHRPETAILYQVVESHLEGFLEAAHERHVVTRREVS
jgi:hypothetical protein